MPHPTPYEPSYSFTEWQVLNPSRPLPADEIDQQFALIQDVLQEIIDRAELIQRDDGELANGSVNTEQFAAGLDLGFNPPAPWATAQSYDTRDTVFSGTSMYRCTVDHVSGSFATDLSAGKWLFVADLQGPEGDVGPAGPAGPQGIQGIQGIQGPPGESGDGTGDMLAENNLSDLDDASVARTNLGVAIGADVQAFNAKLAALAGLTLAADKLIYATGASALATTDLTAAARALLDDANTGVMRTTLGLAIGTDVQAQSAILAALAGLSPADSKLAYFTGASAMALIDLTSYARSLLDDTNAATARATLGLGTAAVLNAGTSAGQLVQLDGSARLPAVDASLLTNVPSGSGAWTLFGSFTISSGTAALDITDLPAFDVIRLTFVNVRLASSIASLYMRASIDNGVSFLAGAQYGNSAEDTQGVTQNLTAITFASILDTGANGGVFGDCTIFETVGTSPRLYKFKAHTLYRNASPSDITFPIHGAFNTGTAADLNALRLLPSTGNFTSGRVLVEYIAPAP